MRCSTKAGEGNVTCAGRFQETRHPPENYGHSTIRGQALKTGHAVEWSGGEKRLKNRRALDLDQGAVMERMCCSLPQQGGEIVSGKKVTPAQRPSE